MNQTVNEILSVTPVLDALSSLLGPVNVVLPGNELSKNLQNTSHFEEPNVLGWVKPTQAEQIPEILSICRQHHFPVYTYSNGLNWGLGSRLPYEDDCILLELSNLNQILEINEQFHYAIVEPGVTQEQLSNEINRRGLKLILNVTGSSPKSSVLGNTMERGSGFLEHRINDLKGMEVILADGTIIQSGFWNMEPSQREIQHFPMGMGPDWRGLFSQSNLGIVCKGVINLTPKKEVQKMLWCKVEQAKMPALVEAIAGLYQRHYIHSVTHIGNDKRMKIEHKSAEQGTTWTSMAMIQGSGNFVRFLEEEIPVYLEGLCLSMGFLTKEEAEAMELGEIFGCHVGIPTDYFVRAMYKSEDAELDPNDIQIDFGKYGMLCCLPVLPAKAEDIKAAIDILESIEHDFGILPAATLNPMNDQCLESVINIYFDRYDPESVKKAHDVNNEMIRRFYTSGFRFYRFDVKTLHTYINPENTHWKLVARLKKALDPDRILSPGRYEAKN
jgi:4-cresol dehydrogenase (hydroxylating)